MSKLETLDGGCLCGRIRYCIQGIPEHTGHCHCPTCRKTTGAAFATFIWAAADKITWLGEEPMAYRSSDVAQRGFCASCGTAIYFRYDAEQDEGWDIHVGSLDNPGAITPKFHVWYPGHVRWLTLTDDLPRHERNSPESDVQI